MKNFYAWVALVVLALVLVPSTLRAQAHCAGERVRFPLPARSTLHVGEPVYLLFAPCIAAPGVVVAGRMIEAEVPAAAVSGPVRIADATQTWVSACAAGAQRVAAAQSMCALATDAGLGRDALAMCRSMGLTPQTLRSIAEANLQACQIARCSGVALGRIDIGHAPRPWLGLADDTLLGATITREAEFGAHTLRWRVDSDVPLLEVRVNGAVEHGTTGDLPWPLATVRRIGRLRARNRCGNADIAVTFMPVLTLSAPDTTVTDSAAASIVVSSAEPVPGAITLAATVGSSAFVIETAPSQVDLANGATSSTTLLVHLDPAQSTWVAPLHLVPTTPPIGDLVVRMANDPMLVGHTRAPAPGSVRVTGRIQYDDGGVAPRPVRSAQVELRDPQGRLTIAVTGDDGRFDIDARAATSFQARLCTRNDRHQVDLELDPSAALCFDIGTAIVSRTRAGLGDVVIRAPLFERRLVDSVNAFDVIVGANAYAATLGLPRLGRVRVIPKLGGTAAAVARPAWSTDIWVAWDDMRNDVRILHEYGHHVEHMMGTYMSWAATHDGCYVNVDLNGADGGTGTGYLCTTPGDRARVALLSGNDPLFAMFEGFASTFANLVLTYGNGTSWTAATEYSLSWFPPAVSSSGCACPAVGFTGANLRTIDATAVEHYIAGALLRLVGNAAINPDGTAVAPDVAARELVDVLRTVGRPTYRTFRTEWLRRHPGNSLQGIDQDYGF